MAKNEPDIPKDGAAHVERGQKLNEQVQKRQKQVREAFTKEKPAVALAHKPRPATREH